ncbi:lipocalin family protein [Mangrovimonas cancribranchiae]|uniref:Lipocalin-like domain-containing protein n=1 Tax=Mangrovimonas cancribranchiae TaxID=3080055 RepID=A0AAU6NYM3_9FLAO
MKYITALLSCLFVMSCSQNKNIQDLNGYWEIEEVVMPDGTKKAYNFNNTIDFIELTSDSTGFRKKLKPNFNGTYETSNVVIEETFVVKKENDSLHLYYKTPYSSWKETILLLDEEALQVINKNQIIYTYKPYHPIKIE